VFSVTENKGKYFSIPADGSGMVLGDFGLAPTSAAISYVGNGWYRCSITFTTTAASQNVRYYPCDTGSTFIYTGNGTSGIFVWGAQFEQAAAATTYTRNNGGRFPARFDYDPVTLAPKGILIEEQRVNLVTYSQEFDNAAWSKPTGTITANALVSPDGTTNADTYIQNNGTTGEIIRAANITVTADVDFSITGFFKAVSTTPAVSLYATAGGNGFRLVANLSTGAVVSSGALGTGTYTSGFVQAFGNGWFRVSVTGKLATGVTTGQWRAAMIDLALNPVVGDGTKGLGLWGAQLEQAAFATSYIPTVASQVTRAADVCTITAPMFAPWYNQTEGTFVMNATPVNNGCYALAATDGTANEEIILRYASTGSAAVVRDGGTIQANFGTGVLTGKNALAYKVNDFAVSTNGGAAATDTSGTVPTNNQVSLGRAFDGTLNINGHIRSVEYYPVRLADFQLQALSA